MARLLKKKLLLFDNWFVSVIGGGTAGGSNGQSHATALQHGLAHVGWIVQTGDEKNVAVFSTTSRTKRRDRNRNAVSYVFDASARVHDPLRAATAPGIGFRGEVSEMEREHENRILSEPSVDCI